MVGGSPLSKIATLLEVTPATAETAASLAETGDCCVRAKVYMCCRNTAAIL